jgi:hypothetical protein
MITVRPVGELGHRDRVHPVPQSPLDTQHLGAQAGGRQEGKTRARLSRAREGLKNLISFCFVSKTSVSLVSRVNFVMINHHMSNL